MSDYHKILRLIEENVKDVSLKEKLIELVESEERNERWEREKKRRHEVSLDIEKVSVKVEFELSYKRNDTQANVQGFDGRDIINALIFLNEEERDLINLLFFSGFTEREVARQKGVSQVAIHKQKHQILKKLENILRNFSK
ncbi:sigma factor-like helix-turn-helix DNA-binding protein [Erysipelothrix rhusiopathiae]|nr:sigma factor-like helix-turn-helix DNA-binding protein [Erysipelothrix rhusiopathiae]